MVRNTGYSTAGQVLSVLGATIGAVVTARLLGPAGRGEYAAAISAVGIVAIVSLFGCGMAAPSHIARGSLGLKGCLWLTAGLGCAGAAVTLLVEAIVGAHVHLLGGAIDGWILALGAAALVVGAMQGAVASGFGRLGSSAANQVVTTAVTAACLLLILPLVPHESRLRIALILWMAGQWVGDVAGWLLLLRNPPVSAQATRFSLRGFTRFAAAAYPGTIVGQLAFRLDIVLLPLLATRADTGVYSIAVVAGGLVAMVPSALAQAMVSPLGVVSGQRAARIARQGVLAALTAATLTGVVLLGALSMLAVPLLGQGYAALPRVFAVLLPGVVVFAPVSVMVSYANTTLVRPHIASLVAGLLASIDIALLVVFAPRYGASGAALASSISYACAAGVMAILTRRAALPGSSSAMQRPTYEGSKV